MDFYNFYKGNCFDAYEFFGAHVTDQNTWFRTYAPAANHVAVIGEFNDWTETPMHRSYDGSTWECCIPAAQPGQPLPRPLRPLRLRHGTAPEERVHHPGASEV